MSYFSNFGANIANLSSLASDLAKDLSDIVAPVAEDKIHNATGDARPSESYVAEEVDGEGNSSPSDAFRLDVPQRLTSPDNGESDELMDVELSVDDSPRTVPMDDTASPTSTNGSGREFDMKLQQNYCEQLELELKRAETKCKDTDSEFTRKLAALEKDNEAYRRELQIKNDNSSKGAQDTISKQDTMIAELTDAKQTINQLTKMNRQSENRCKELQSESERLTCQNTMSSKEIVRLEVEMEKFKLDLHQQSMDSASEMESFASSKNQLVATLRSEIANLQVALNAARTTGMSESDTKRDRDNLHAELAHSKQEVIHLRAEVQEINTALHTSKRKQEQTESALEQV